MTEKATSAHVRAALSLRYPPSEHALLFEVPNGTGGNGRVFADAVAFGLWPSHGHLVEGVEIKVTRSDFLSEMKKPLKSQPVFQYCDRWWLACPKGMVSPDELPPTWGLLELCGDVLRQKVKAPKLSPESMPRTFIAGLLRRHAGADEAMVRVLVQREVQAERLRMEESLRREYERRHSVEEEQARTASIAWQKVLDETGIDFKRMHNEAEFCEAVKLVVELNGRWGSPLSELRRGAKRLLELIDESPLLTPKVDA